MKSGNKRKRKVIQKHEDKKHEDNKEIFLGSSSQAMSDLPIKICKKIRNYLFNNEIGVQFPFHFSKDDYVINLIKDKNLDINDVRVDLVFRKGYCKESVNQDYKNFIGKENFFEICFRNKLKLFFLQDKKKKEFGVKDNKHHDYMKKVIVDKKNGKVEITNDFGGKSTSDKFKTNIPYIYEKIGNTTSQGKVYLSLIDVDDININMVVKVDKLDQKSEKNQWFSNSKDHIKGMYDTYTVISASYIDALCSILFSNLVETGISPHFPLCYSTNVSNIKFKFSAKGGRENIFLIIINMTN